MNKIKYRIIDLKTKDWIYFVMKDLLTKPNLFKNVNWKYLGSSLGSDCTDINNKEIYTGDYVKIKTFFVGSGSTEEARKYSDRFEKRGIIYWKTKEFYAIDLVDMIPDKEHGILGKDMMLRILEEHSGADITLNQIDSNDLEIIGNEYYSHELNKISI